MNRGHTRADYIGLVAEIRGARPDIALSSDFIAGFPGESEEDFAATLDLVEKVEFANAFSFKYSPRAGTPAAELRDQIPKSVKSERLARLQTLLDGQRQTFNRKMAGRTLEVLIEKPGLHAGQIAGKSPYLQAVQIEGSLDRIGEIVRAEIVSAGANSLFGRLLPDRAAREAPR
jgi:tRNA-2-methylthio-N6-dimethylallyladenosine synthase